MSAALIDRHVVNRADTPAQQHPTELSVEQRSSIRHDLEVLVEAFETNRGARIETDGVGPTAAYDMGIKRAVHEAPDGITGSEFGRCTSCAGSIAIERLRVTPDARRCVNCQQYEEERWNQFERFVASVVRELAGEPQGRTPLPPDRRSRRVRSNPPVGGHR